MIQQQVVANGTGITGPRRPYGHTLPTVEVEAGLDWNHLKAFLSISVGMV